jgi:hypothetical protein
MIRIAALSLGLAALTLASIRPDPAPLAGRDTPWRTSSIWDDGKAEFAAYAVAWPRYGKVRQGRGLLISVKEPWAPDLDVKADKPRPDGFDVLKLNHIRDFETGIYAYHQMASAFIRRDTGVLRKLSVMSSEACGLTTALMTNGRLRTASYWDGQGERTHDWPADAIPEDALPLMLRDAVTGPVPDFLLLAPSFMSVKTPTVSATRWTVKREETNAPDAAGTPVPAIRLRLEADDRTHTLVFAREVPHVLLSWHQPDGTTYTLAKVERLPYWAMNQPGDESWWPESLR